MNDALVVLVAAACFASGWCLIHLCLRLLPKHSGGRR